MGIAKGITTDAKPASGDVSVLNVIDLSSPDIPKSVALLKQACLDSGFFYAVNHGISQDLIDEVFAQSKKFFGLPLAEKMKTLRNKSYRGYTPMQDEVLDAENPIGDYKEGFWVGIDLPEGDPDAYKSFAGPNQWPSEDVVPGFRETLERYHAEALEVSKSISRLIALALGLESDFFDKPERLGRAIANLRVMHYDARKSDVSKGILGANAHTDFGLLTLLVTDESQALQICKDKDARPQVWEYVPPMKGAFIVNLADMLERWSNMLFRSTLHRVICSGQDRYSAAFFVEPSHTCLIECLPTCKSEDNPAKYPPIISEDYLSRRFKETHVDVKSHQIPQN